MNLSEEKRNNATKHLNSFFDKIYIVTIERAKDRHEFIKKSLDGLNYEFVYGQDRNDLTPDIIAKDYDKSAAQKLRYRNSGLRDNEVAIALSHRKVYQKIVDEKVEKALIFEDDAFFIEKNTLFIPKVISELPKDWEFLYFGYNQDKEATFSDKLKMFVYLILRFFKSYHRSYTQILNRFPKKYSEHLQIAGLHEALHAYAITFSAAKKLIHHQTPVKYSADNLPSALCMKRILKGFIAVPKIFSQAGLDREISKLIKSINK